MSVIEVYIGTPNWFATATAAGFGSTRQRSSADEVLTIADAWRGPMSPVPMMAKVTGDELAMLVNVIDGCNTTETRSSSSTDFVVQLRYSTSCLEGPEVVTANAVVSKADVNCRC